MTARPASLRRRLLSLVYEVLLMLAVLVIASFPVAPLVQAMPAPWGRHFQQLYLLVVAGGYLVWFWTHGGQTLAMKTWRIRLVSASGDTVRSRQAWLRYALALLGLAACGLGFLWALWDRERQFLHDRLAGTRLVESTALDAPQRHGGPQPEQHQGG
ncbi:MAG: RDD family protein [Thiobacillaceae bacterium]